MHGLEPSGTGYVALYEGSTCAGGFAGVGDHLVTPAMHHNYMSDAQGVASRSFDLSAQESVVGRTVVFHQNDIPVACGVLTAPKRVATATVSATAGSSAQISGDIDLTTFGAGYTIKYTINGLTPGSNGTLHVHEGRTCDDVGFPFYSGSNSPWTELLYSADARGIASASADLPTVKTQLIGRTFVVRPSGGGNAACGVLQATNVKTAYNSISAVRLAGSCRVSWPRDVSEDFDHVTTYNGVDKVSKSIFHLDLTQGLRLDSRTCSDYHSNDDMDSSIMWQDYTGKIATTNTYASGDSSFMTMPRGSNTFTGKHSGLPNAPSCLTSGCNHAKPIPFPFSDRTAWVDGQNSRIIWKDGNSAEHTATYSEIGCTCCPTWSSSDGYEDVFITDGISSFYLTSHNGADCGAVLTFDFDANTVTHEPADGFHPVGGYHGTEQDVFGHLLWTVNGRPFYKGSNYNDWVMGESLYQPSSVFQTLTQSGVSLSGNTQYGLDQFIRVGDDGRLWFGDWGHDNGGMFNCGNDDHLGMARSNIELRTEPIVAQTPAPAPGAPGNQLTIEVETRAGEFTSVYTEVMRPGATSLLSDIDIVLPSEAAYRSLRIHQTNGMFADCSDTSVEATREYYSDRFVFHDCHSNKGLTAHLELTPPNATVAIDILSADDNVWKTVHEQELSGTQQHFIDELGLMQFTQQRVDKVRLRGNPNTKAPSMPVLDESALATRSVPSGFPDRFSTVTEMALTGAPVAKYVGFSGTCEVHNVTTAFNAATTYNGVSKVSKSIFHLDLTQGLRLDSRTCSDYHSNDDMDSSIMWQDYTGKIATTNTYASGDSSFMTMPRGSNTFTGKHSRLPNAPSCLTSGCNHAKPIPFPFSDRTAWVDGQNSRIIWKDGNSAEHTATYSEIGCTCCPTWSSSDGYEDVFITDGISSFYLTSHNGADCGAVLTFDFDANTVTHEPADGFHPVGGYHGTEQDVFGHLLWTVNGRPFYKGSNYNDWVMGESLYQPSSVFQTLTQSGVSLSGNTQYGLDQFIRVGDDGRLWFGDWGHDNGGMFNCGNDDHLGMARSNIVLLERAHGGAAGVEYQSPAGDWQSLFAFADSGLLSEMGRVELSKPTALDKLRIKVDDGAYVTNCGPAVAAVQIQHFGNTNVTAFVGCNDPVELSFNRNELLDHEKSLSTPDRFDIYEQDMVGVGGVRAMIFNGTCRYVSDAVVSDKRFFQVSVYDGNAWNIILTRHVSSGEVHLADLGVIDMTTFNRGVTKLRIEAFKKTAGNNEGFHGCEGLKVRFNPQPDEENKEFVTSRIVRTHSMPVDFPARFTQTTSLFSAGLSATKLRFDNGVCRAVDSAVLKLQIYTRASGMWDDVAIATSQVGQTLNELFGEVNFSLRSAFGIRIVPDAASTLRMHQKNTKLFTGCDRMFVRFNAVN